MLGKSVGIDLGTTNSVVALKVLECRAVANQEGDDLTPSCVTLIGEGGTEEFVVGRASKNLLKQYPENTVVSVKRLMGRGFDEAEVQRLVESLAYGYSIENDPNNPGAIRIPLGAGHFTPEALSAKILAKVCTDASATLGAAVTHAVVTVPAYFSDRQKFATRAACKLAGIELLRLLPEPTAAAISFGFSDMSESDAKNIVVFDLGGGTFDVSVLSVAGGHFMEVTKGGDMWLGGDDIDALLKAHVFATVEKSLMGARIVDLVDRLSPAHRARFTSEINQACETAKIQLSSDAEATIELFGTLKDASGKFVDINVTVSRAEFDALVNPIAQRLTMLTHELLAGVHFEPDMIDTVLMVGGSSLVPALQQALRESFGAEKVLVHPRPLLAIAEGASIMAHRLSSKVTEGPGAFSIMHSAAHDYYLQLALGGRHRLVERNAPLPCHAEETLSFVNASQWVARLRVFNDVDGILETVGETWFHRDTSDPLAMDVRDEEASGTIPTLKLRFSIDEDNIVEMCTSPAHEPDRVTAAVIARGGLAVRLFSELENALAECFSLSGSAIGSRDFVRLSQFITPTILSASDPLSGVVSEETSAKASQQIATLVTLAKKHPAPIRTFQYSKRVCERAVAAFEPDVQDRLRDTVAGLEFHLRSLTDAAALNQHFEDLRNLTLDTPLVGQMGYGLYLAHEGKVKWAAAGRRIEEKIQLIVAARTAGQMDFLEMHRQGLLRELSEFTSVNEVSAARFDRDVELAR